MTDEQTERGVIRASRLEAFSDGVLAIIITIMVLEIRPPEGHELSDWQPLVPVVLAYLFSFTFIAIYWNNHHHLLRATRHVSASVMWANMLLLFFLSLIPVTTAWVGEDGNFLRSGPVALYTAVSLGAGVAYFLLTLRIGAANPGEPRIRAFITSRKGSISAMAYVAALGFAFFFPVVALGIMIASAALWFVPDHLLVDDPA